LPVYLRGPFSRSVVVFLFFSFSLSVSVSFHPSLFVWELGVLRLVGGNRARGRITGGARGGTWGVSGFFTCDTGILTFVPGRGMAFVAVVVVRWERIRNVVVDVRAVGDAWPINFFVLGSLGTSSMGKAGQVGQGAVGRAQGRAGPLASGLLVGRECNFPFVSTAS